MMLPQALIAFVFLCVAVIATDFTPNKRSPLLQGRQDCGRAGWIPACPVGIACVPIGAICCDDGVSYAMPPDTCPEGTNPIATATISAVPTITSAPTLPPSPPVVSLTFFTTEFTWYYYYYYFIYIAAETTLTSSYVTTVSTVSVSATDSAAANAAFASLSATIQFPTPVQSSTAISGLVPTSTVLVPTSASPTIVLPTETSTGGGSVGSTTFITAPSPTFVQVPVGGSASSFKAGGGLGVATICLLALTPGILMLWL